MINERLKKLRKERNLLQKDIAKYLNISTSAYGYYEQGKRDPDTETIKKLADYFDISADYLLGRTDNKNNYTKSDNSIDSSKYNAYLEMNDKIHKNLIDKGVVIEDEKDSKYVFDKVIKYGIDTAIEIIKLEKKLEGH